MRTVRILFLVCLAAVAAAAAGGIYVLSVALGENVTFEEYDPAYWIVVTSDTVRDFPRFEAEGQTAVFTYDARDGTAPEMIDVQYASSEQPDALARRFYEHCALMAFSPVSKDDLFLPGDLGCDAPDYRIEIALAPRGGGTSVTVRFLEN